MLLHVTKEEPSWVGIHLSKDASVEFYTTWLTKSKGARMLFDVRVEPTASMMMNLPSKVVMEVGGGGDERVRWRRNGEDRGREGRETMTRL